MWHMTQIKYFEMWHMTYSSISLMYDEYFFIYVTFDYATCVDMQNFISILWA